jgi:tetratricopeptide (TPR) repeat protein
MHRTLAWILALVALALGVTLFLRRQPPEWTTGSRAALAEFQQGLDADMKFYHAEALAHFRRAAELDPSFAMAKLKQLSLLDFSEKDEIERLAAELRNINTENLTDRERFLITHRLARLDKQHARAQKLLTAYVEEHPEDPYALTILCGYAWEGQDWQEAESCYRRLLKIDPNWVTAQNHLGYTALAQGRFREAEELFRTYLFIAPDQANPHDSIGEMLALQGRYDEAAKEFEEALRIKPDFCASWLHLLSCELDQGKFAEARQRLAALPEMSSCDPDMYAAQSCRIALRESLSRGDFAAAWAAAADEDCSTYAEELFVLRYRAALGAGQTAAAAAMEAELAERGARQAKETPLHIALAAHTAGLRLLVTGDAAGAAAALRRADDSLVYWGEGLGTFKLLNRLDLVAALQAAGDVAGAQAVLEQVREVNPARAARVAGRTPAQALWL